MMIRAYGGADVGGLFPTYDPYAGDWVLKLPTPWSTDLLPGKGWSANCIPTAKGMVAWCGGALLRPNAAGTAWEKLPLEDPKKLAPPNIDQSAGAYDSKRDRLLLFGPGLKGDVQAYDEKTGRLQLLHPAGAAAAATWVRESVYLPDADAVLLGTVPVGDDNKSRWLVYDCAKNAWRAIKVPGANVNFMPSLGLTYDPKRQLVWATNNMSVPHVARLDFKTADIVDLQNPASPPDAK